MRFSRDKRGYENTFVVHAEKRRGRSRSRILYWFRTPPGVKVGRSALDEDAIRLIEEHNPEVDFDWTRILKGGGEPVEVRKPEAPRREMRQRGPNQPPRQSPDRDLPAAPPEKIPDEAAAEAMASTGPDAVLDSPEILEPPPAEIPTVEIAAAGAHEAPTPAHARLGAEAVIRLRGRHAEILTRISERVQDPVRRDELKGEAERLNPDSWVTEAEVLLGLEQYETVFEALRAVVGRRRRRRRRRGSRPEGMSPQVESGSGSESEVHQEDDDSPGHEDDPGSGEL